MSNADYFLKQIERSIKRENTEMTIFGIFMIFLSFLAFFSFDFKSYFYQENYKDLVFSIDRIKNGVIDYQRIEGNILFPEEELMFHSFERKAFIDSGLVYKSDYDDFIYSFHYQNNFFLISEISHIEVCEIIAQIQQSEKYNYHLYENLNSLNQSLELTNLLLNDRRNIVCFSVEDQLYAISTFDFTENTNFNPLK